jgi:dCTP diphosphatase
VNEIIELTNKIKQFRDERSWAQFHNHKDMALSLVLEATEVLEHFQWKSPKEVIDYGKTSKDAISEELADVAIYLFELADNLGVDLSKAIENKLDKNAQKYPAEKARGKHTKYNKL